MKALIRVVILCIVGLSCSVSAETLYGVKVSIGSGERSTDAYQVSLLSDYGQQLFQNRVALYWEVGYSHWSSSKGPEKQVDAINVSPVFRYDFSTTERGCVPYVSYSVGLAYLSETRVADKNLGMHFQFDNKLDVGMRFGSGERHDLAIGVRHVSNAGLDSDNDGFDVVRASYSYRF